jgi:hypothetical protein
MSVTFYISGKDDSLTQLQHGCALNVNNVNACELIEALGLDVVSPHDLIGEIRGRDLKARCLKALAGPRDDSAIEQIESVGAKGSRVIECGRRPGYVTEKLQAMLRLAEAAGDLGIVVWE